MITADLSQYPVPKPSRCFALISVYVNALNVLSTRSSQAPDPSKVTSFLGEFMADIMHKGAHARLCWDLYS